MITKEEQERIEKYALERAERICKGGFPIEYSREQVVNHTKNDFVDGATYERELANTELSKLSEENEQIKAEREEWRSIAHESNHCLTKSIKEVEQLKSDKKELLDIAETMLYCLVTEQEIRIWKQWRKDGNLNLVAWKEQALAQIELFQELLAKHSNQNSDEK